MTASEVRDRIRSNLLARGWNATDLRVQPDPFVGWRIRVVSKDMLNVPHRDRRLSILAGLEEEHTEGAELLTPQEVEWAGPSPVDSDLQDLPLWPEALGKTRLVDMPIKAVFASDLDEDIERPLIATFYSLKGGVGRTTALAYTALDLASRGYKVVCVDMDLEAPGLAAVFGLDDQVMEGVGVIHVLNALDCGEDVDLRRHLIRRDESLDLYVLPAGTPNAEYIRLLRFIDPSAWYREDQNPLLRMVEMLRTLRFSPDVILFDARTGFQALNAPLLFEISDISVITFFPHPQTRRGTEELVRALLSSKTRREANGDRLTPMPRFLVSPIPASKAPEVVKRYQHRALEWISDWLSSLDNRDRLSESDLTHFVPYREIIATSDSVIGDKDAWSDYRPIAEWLMGFLPAPGVATTLLPSDQGKNVVLRQLRFDGDTAERQQRLLESFVETPTVARALALDVPLVLGRKGTGKTAIFRRLSEKGDRQAVIALAPAPLSGQRPWVLSVDGFKRVDESLTRLGGDWRELWAVIVGLAVKSEWKGPIPPADSGIAGILTEPLTSELKVVDVVEKILSVQGAGLLVADWLDRLDAASQPTLVLFDGLDTGFGNTDDGRERRLHAVEGLFSFLTDRGDRFSHLRLKVVLREDIWRDVRFENKSHLFGRSVSLRWTQQMDFARVIIKQAMQADAFVAHLGSASRPNEATSSQVEQWSDDAVDRAWNILVGERMKGGKTAFTRNWVWNRLADGSGDRIPRYLIQLFDEAVQWELNENSKSPYDRSLIRPRALIDSLGKVSEKALSALRDEEFPELDRLFVRLSELKSTPVSARDIEPLGDIVKLAREVGLLEVYEGTEDLVERYKVPDVYRLGLGMTRKGQA